MSASPCVAGTSSAQAPFALAPGREAANAALVGAAASEQRACAHGAGQRVHARSESVTWPARTRSLDVLAPLRASCGQSTALARICSLGTAPSEVEAHLESQHAAAARASMEYRLEAIPEVLRRPRGLSGGSSSDAIALPVVPMAASASGRRNSITLRVRRRWSSPAEAFPAWEPATLETVEVGSSTDTQLPSTPGCLGRVSMEAVASTYSERV